MNAGRTFVVIFAVVFGVERTSLAGLITVAGKSGKPPVIVCPDEPQCREMGDYLRRFLSSRDFVSPSGLETNSLDSDGASGWILATEDTYSTLNLKEPLPDFFKGARDEAYVLEAKSTRRGPRVLLLGKTSSGLRSAMARFVCKVANDGRSLRIEEGTETADPFVRMRGVIMGNAGRRQCAADSPFRDIDFETWDDARLNRYPDLFWQFGFNCVQIAENRGYGSITGERLKQAQHSLLAFASAARNRHMLVSLDVWGDCLFQEGESYCWNDPVQHKAMVEFIGEMGRLYGPHVDHFNVHIGDPGGCTRNGCDPSYKTSQEITAEYFKVFHNYNSNVMGAMSTWANSPFWSHSPRPVDLSNYREYFNVPQPRFGVPMGGGAQFLDETYMPREVGVALHQSYDADQAALLAQAGRPVDIWAWYIGDMEMRNNLYIAMHRVDEAYGKLSGPARDYVRLGTVEICFHGWPQIINQYCAAQKMWNPQRSIEDIEMEFCVGAFGPKHAKAALELYRVCENGVREDIPKPSDFGTPKYNRRLKSVLARAEAIDLPLNWKPNFEFPVPVRKYLDMLIARARLTLAVSEASAAVNAARKRGALSEEIARIKRTAIAALPDLPIDPIYRQDATIVEPAFKAETFAERIADL